MAESKLKYKDLAFGSFGVGLVSLSLAIPGYLTDWREYRICQTYFGITTCQTRAYTFTNPEQARIQPYKIHFGEPLTKMLGAAIACLAFPLSAYAAAKQSELCEFAETAEAINKTAELQSITQQRASELKLGSEAYEAMKALEYADIIDRFQATIRIPVSTEEIEAEIQEKEHQLQQAQSRKVLEFDVEEPQPEQIEVSEKAQKLLAYLQKRKASKDSPISVDRINKNKIIPDTDAAEIRQLFVELTQAGLTDLNDDGGIYLT